MAKKLQLHVPTPCHENWENMTRTEKGRFCASCQKQVIDFSNKSDREIAMFFKKPSTGSVCGRFMEDQLSRDIDIPKKRIPWLKYFFQFLIPAFFISYRATAQGKVKVVSSSTAQTPKHSNSAAQGKISRESIANEVCERRVSSAENILYPELNIFGKKPKLEFDTSYTEMQGLVSSVVEAEVIEGRVTDDSRQPIAFATIAIKGTKIAVAADSVGRFTIRPKLNWKNITLSVSSVGFVPSEKKISRSHRVINLEIELQQITMDEIVVADRVEHRKISLLGQVSRMNGIHVNDSCKVKNSFNSDPNSFNIYPNPIRSNSTLTIEWKQNQYGDHLLQLFNQSGQLIISKDIYIDEKTRQLTMDIPAMISGNYFLKLTSKASGKSYTEKLIVD